LRPFPIGLRKPARYCAGTWVAKCGLEYLKKVAARDLSYIQIPESFKVMKMESKTAATPLNEYQTTKPTHSESTTPPKSFEKEEEFKQESKDASQNSLAGEGTEPANSAEPEGEWVEGTKLLMVITSLTFGSLLMLLDTSIVSTVSVWYPGEYYEDILTKFP
jgi:hypothetical protein